MPDSGEEAPCKISVCGSSQAGLRSAESNRMSYMAPIRFVDTGVLYCDDNLALLAEFPDECVDLIYLDPPFFSNRHYEVIWGDEAEVRSFGDRWKGDIDVYIEWMEARLRQMHRVLRPTGSLYLHCDQAAGHYLKQALDGIFALSCRFRG